MSILQRVVRNESYLNTQRRPFLSNGLETVGYAGFSYIAGRVNTQYGERAEWKGVDATYATGLIAKAVTLAADFFGLGDEGWAYEGLNVMSNAFIGAHFVAKGAEDGEAAAKKSEQRSLPASRSTTPKAAMTGTTALGAIPPMPGPGKFLDLDRVAAIAAM